MKYLIKIGFVFFIATFLSACKEPYTPPPKFPYKHIRSIAVCPVAIQIKKDADGYPLNLDQEILGRLAAEEMQKFQNDKGFSVMYPSEVLAKMNAEKMTLTSKEEVKQLGNLLQVDAICLLQINQYSDFSPKRCSLTFYLFETNADVDIAYQIVNISGFGSAYSAETLEEDKAVENIAMIQRQWDSLDERTKKRAQAWANRIDHIEETRWQSVLEIKDRFFRMIFHYTIRDYIHSVNELQENKAKPGKHPLSILSVEEEILSR